MTIAFKACPRCRGDLEHDAPDPGDRLCLSCGLVEYGPVTELDSEALLAEWQEDVREGRAAAGVRLAARFAEWSEAQRRVAERMVRHGATKEEIAETMGVSVRQVARYLADGRHYKTTKEER